MVFNVCNRFVIYDTDVFNHKDKIIFAGFHFGLCLKLTRESTYFVTISDLLMFYYIAFYKFFEKSYLIMKWNRYFDCIQEE